MARDKSREEDDAVALVRVYCGLASANAEAQPASAGKWLTAAVVDDAGRLLDIREISDDPTGYAQLGALLAERSGGPTTVAIAADSDDHLVTVLLNAAGRSLAFADDEAADDYAERFADDESVEEMESPQADRRAVGLARALQAGALSAVALPAPRDLAGYTPVLAAHAALAAGRHSAAVALREVLRELYPAALRAYPDPAEPVALAVLNALPEPGMLGTTTNGRSRDAAGAADAVIAQLSGEGIADPTVVADAVTALCVAVAETPRRSTVSRNLTPAVTEAVRQAVAAVRACDLACAALVGTLAERVTTPAPAPARRGARRAASDLPASAPPAPLRPVREPLAEPTSPRVPTRRSRPHPAPTTGVPYAPQPMLPPPVAPPPVTPRSGPSTPVVPAAASLPPAPAMPAAAAPAVPVAAPPMVSAPPAPSTQAAPPRAVGVPEPISNRPVSAPPPPPPGITPIVPTQRTSVPPAEAGQPFRATLTTAAINSARAARAATHAERPAPEAPARPAPSATDFTLGVPAVRPEPAAPGSRANWPLVGSADERADQAGGEAYGFGNLPPSELDLPATPMATDGRVTPPWQADDLLPPEPPMLRLVGTPPLRDRTMRDDSRLDTPPLRLVEPESDHNGRSNRGQRVEPGPVSAPPVSDEGDGDLLIFAAARSAWFVGQPDDEAANDVDWSSAADAGWEAAASVARPSVGEETTAGLPRRVPQANLVPGSPLRDERPLRIVRDAASIAAHTTGYFHGWRRGQEIGGYAPGGRPGRESAAGWEFSRDDSQDDARGYEYRSAGYRS